MITVACRIEPRSVAPASSPTPAPGTPRRCCSTATPEPITRPRSRERALRVGVANPAEIVEARVQALPSARCSAMYTDGLIERRGENIDDGIDVLGEVLRSGSAGAPDLVVKQIGERIGAPVDDVALLVLTLDRARVSFEIEVPAEPSSLPAIRRRLRAWLARRSPAPSRAADYSCSRSARRATTRSSTPTRGASGTIRVAITDGARHTLRRRRGGHRELAGAGSSRRRKRGRGIEC